MRFLKTLDRTDETRNVRDLSIAGDAWLTRNRLDGSINVRAIILAGAALCIPLTVGRSVWETRLGGKRAAA
jgi:hypothetical protein